MHTDWVAVARLRLTGLLWRVAALAVDHTINVRVQQVVAQVQLVLVVKF
jgi:hypothetical protein